MTTDDPLFFFLANIICFLILGMVFLNVFPFLKLAAGFVGAWTARGLIFVLDPLCQKALVCLEADSNRALKNHAPLVVAWMRAKIDAIAQQAPDDTADLSLTERWARGEWEHIEWQKSLTITLLWTLGSPAVVNMAPQYLRRAKGWARPSLRLETNFHFVDVPKTLADMIFVDVSRPQSRVVHICALGLKSLLRRLHTHQDTYRQQRWEAKQKHVANPVSLIWKEAYQKENAVRAKIRNSFTPSEAEQIRDSGLAQALEPRKTKKEKKQTMASGMDFPGREKNPYDNAIVIMKRRERLMPVETNHERIALRQALSAHGLTTQE